MTRVGLYLYNLLYLFTCSACVTRVGLYLYNLLYLFTCSACVTRVGLYLYNLLYLFTCSACVTRVGLYLYNLLYLFTCSACVTRVGSATDVSRRTAPATLTVAVTDTVTRAPPTPSRPACATPAIWATTAACCVLMERPRTTLPRLSSCVSAMHV